MKRMILLWLLNLLLFNSCSDNKETEEIIDRECRIEIDTIDFTFGVDYKDTIKYLTPGEQSDLDDLYFQEIKTSIAIPDNSIEGILSVCHWVNQNFRFENAGGAMIGKVNVDTLYQCKKFYGCHSQALIISSILREFGFPAILIETADVKWGYKYHEGTIDYFSGHVMSEIYVEGRWILLNNNCTYVENYNPDNPYIPMMDDPSNGYFVFAKGIDTWDYSGKDPDFTWDQLIFFSDNIYCFEEMFKTVSYDWNN